ncbi:YjiH family protein [Aquibacillus sediminis]|uniref:YjiH family protein n=1 Tax=Aquibacillus sediminis TaxID=2574734 RepID=UPI001108FC6E|nr:YjiH family protein [Aquibacillus sediminis]
MLLKEETGKTLSLKEELGEQKYYSNLLKSFFCLILGGLVFFVPFQTGEEGTNILFGLIVNFFVDGLGEILFWSVTGIIVLNALGFLYSKYFITEDNWLKKMYKSDSLVLGSIYVLASVYAIMFAFQVGPEMVRGDNTGGVIISSIALPVSLIVALGGMFVAFFIAFGGLQFVGTLLEPVMRPIFKIPGFAALDTVASFFGASSVGAYVTSKLYKENIYTKREAATIATCFCVVSIGFAALVANTVGLLPMFTTVFFVAFLVVLITAFIMVRIPPLSRKPDVYFNGRVQTDEDRKVNVKYNGQLFRNAINRAVSKANDAESIMKELAKGFMEGARLTPKILCLITAVGLTGLIIVEYTPIFTWLGMPMVPFLSLFGIPDAQVIAASTLVGITEMYLPVLLIAEAGVSIQAGFFIAVLSLVQIIFFAETAVIILATGVPISAKELIIVFFERTIIGIPIIAVFMHLLF